MMDRRLSAAAWTALFAVATLISGCADNGGTGGNAPDVTSTPPLTRSAEPDADGGEAAANGDAAESMDDTGDASASSSLEMTPVDKEGYDAVLKKYEGQVVLVDFWGSWCGNCMKGFPHTVALGRKYQDKGLKVVSYSIEFDQDEGRESAEKFLQENDAGFLHNLTSAGEYEETFEDFDLTALPEYRIYDRQGKLVKRFNNDDNLDDEPAFSHDDIEKVVRETLGLPAEDAETDSDANDE
jgi:thiol-disulfide isomerase/thioredoxin